MEGALFELPQILFNFFATKVMKDKSIGKDIYHSVVVTIRLFATIALTIKCGISILSEISINLIMTMMAYFCDIHSSNNTQTHKYIHTYIHTHTHTHTHIYMNI